MKLTFHTTFVTSERTNELCKCGDPRKGNEEEEIQASLTDD